MASTPGSCDREEALPLPPKMPLREDDDKARSDFCTLCSCVPKDVPKKSLKVHMRKHGLDLIPGCPLHDDPAAPCWYFRCSASDVRKHLERKRPHLADTRVTFGLVVLLPGTT